MSTPNELPIAQQHLSDAPNGGQIQTGPPDPSDLGDELTRPSAGRLNARRYQRFVIQSLGIGTFYALVVIFFAVRVPNFLTSSNLGDILAASAALGIVAVGQTIVIIAGGFDLSPGGVVPLGGVVFGQIAISSRSVALALALCVMTGAAVGLLNGLVVARLKLNPLITTLAMLSVSGGVAYVVTNGATLVIDIPSAGIWGNSNIANIQNCAFAFAGLALAGTLMMRYTRFGRSLYAIGGNREAAELAGIRCVLLTVGVYVICGACSAFAGSIFASQLLAAAPNVGTTTTLESIAAVVLGGAALTGGAGGIPGTVLGVLLLGTVADGLSLLQISSYYQTIVTGGILLFAISFARVREILLLWLSNVRTVRKSQ